MKAYGLSKLCNILFTRELARRLHGTGVTANCLHPGFVATRFGDQSGGPIASLLWLAKFFAISPAEGAETIVYLASSPDVATTTGQYFHKRLPTTPSSTARDDPSALLLWQSRAAVAGMKENGILRDLGIKAEVDQLATIICGKDADPVKREQRAGRSHARSPSP